MPSWLSQLESKQKNSWNAFRIRIFLFRSFSCGIETIIRSYAPEVPSKTTPDSRPKWAKCIPLLKRPKNHTRRGGKYLYGLYNLYKGVPPGVSRMVYSFPPNKLVEFALVKRCRPISLGNTSVCKTYSTYRWYKYSRRCILLLIILPFFVYDDFSFRD